MLSCIQMKECHVLIKERDLPDVVCTFFTSVWSEWFLSTQRNERRLVFSRNSVVSQPHTWLNWLIFNSQGVPAHQMTYTRIITAQTEEWAWGFSCWIRLDIVSTRPPEPFTTYWMGLTESHRWGSSVCGQPASPNTTVYLDTDVSYIASIMQENCIFNIRIRFSFTAPCRTSVK